MIHYQLMNKGGWWDGVPFFSNIFLTTKIGMLYIKKVGLKLTNNN